MTTGPRHEYYLLTPGPLTVPRETHEAMLRDRNPGGAEHIGMTRDIQDYLLQICNGTETHACVLLQGSATYGVEAGFQTLIPKDGRLLVIVNGFYGVRLREIAEAARVDTTVLQLPTLPLPTRADIEAALDADPAITHIVLCQAETGTGVLNPVEMVAEVGRERGIKVMVDAVASFGGVAIDVAALDLEAVFISPNKCLESAPGLAIVLVKKSSLIAAEGRCPSAVLDLHHQWDFMQKTGNWRWTPPTHVVAALAHSCKRHAAEGGSGPRLERYRRNWSILVNGLRQKGFTTLLPDDVAIPIIATFNDPADPAYSFKDFHAAMLNRGIEVFPGRLTSEGTFRIGVMGDLYEQDMQHILAQMCEALEEIGVTLPIGGSAKTMETA
ncbi:2-aminoethylphosphonate--pyruvate transaminase [Pseudoroseicyclus tamaricis]|uniref:2-aminoethylphosphonate--pyruvate transaminase n=1 Tax=Pseudoroseicyclus tamaricis TaxID=2705421 RepID=A0A6B2JPD9_9RHOB|nr:2-aminoethylphosphonate--pyruvate transaminase [Pseudoroseicyclus tamaricis]NDV00557.1 2-aminoethylphosphonate--pyruvate transaminase [Pseudoroseicyclus tamaricis]